MAKDQTNRANVSVPSSGDDQSFCLGWSMLFLQYFSQITYSDYHILYDLYDFSHIIINQLRYNILTPNKISSHNRVKILARGLGANYFGLVTAWNWC